MSERSAGSSAARTMQHAQDLDHVLPRFYPMDDEVGPHGRQLACPVPQPWTTAIGTKKVANLSAATISSTATRRAALGLETAT